MPFTTPIYGFRYPALTEPPNGPDQVKNLALDVEAKFAANDAKGYALGLLAKNVYNADGVSGNQTEIVGDKVSFTFDPARSYEFEWQGCISATADRPYMCFAFRAANGATVTTGSPLVRSTNLPVQGNGKFHFGHVTCPVTGAELAALGLTAGTVTVAVTHYITPGNGGGSWNVRGDNGVSPGLPNKRHIAVLDMGVNR